MNARVLQSASLDGPLRSAMFELMRSFFSVDEEEFIRLAALEYKALQYGINDDVLMMELKGRSVSRPCYSFERNIAASAWRCSTPATRSCTRTPGGWTGWPEPGSTRCSRSTIRRKPPLPTVFFEEDAAGSGHGNH